MSQLFSGLRCNRWEREMWRVWRPIYKWENLCPVVASDPVGIFLIMLKADQPVTFEDIKQEDYDYYPDINVKYKSENWGRISGKVVCLDYGLAEASSVQKRREYLEDKRNEFGAF